MVVRAAVIEDSAAICRLLGLLFAQEAEFQPAPGAQAQGVECILSTPELGRFFVIEDAGRVVGCVSLLFSISTALGGKVALLEDFVLDPPARGQGLGTQLLAFAIEHAGQQGCKRITLLTDPDNHAAQALYRKMGFEPSSMLAMRLHLPPLDTADAPTGKC